MRNPAGPSTTTEDPLLPRPSILRRIKQETHDVFTLSTELLSSRKKIPSPFFAPGQFNMLYAFGIGEVPISISDVDQAGVISHTIRAVGAVTRALSSLKSGSIVGLRGPFGTSWPLDRAEERDVLLIAGGIGFASLRPALLHLLSSAKRPRKLTLIYGARTPIDIPFEKELRSYSKNTGLELYLTVDQPAIGWKGSVGVAPEQLSQVSFDPTRCLALICGPEIMMRFTIRALLERSVPDRSIFLSMERNMKCAVGNCGRCQFVPYFLCKDGPILSYDRVRPFFGKKEL